MENNEKIMLARIDERLKTHVDSNANWQAATTVKIEHIEKCVQRDNVRIDRIEQKEIGRARLLWIAIVAAAGSLGAWVKSHWE